MSDEEAPSLSPRQPSYQSFAHRTIAHHLHQAEAEAKLGDSPPDHPFSDASALSPLRSLPFLLLFAQLLWSSTVMSIVYVLADKSQNATTLSAAFWTPPAAQFRISSSVVFAVGWALFVLLCFFVREATARSRQAAQDLAQVDSLLRILVRHLVQVFPQGTWHPFDHDRILAHLIAYPICLKMHLRSERDPSQLRRFLHPEDAHDLLAAPEMHVHAMSVVRSYFASAEPDAAAGFTPHTPAAAGAAGRFFAVQLVDNCDFAANRVLRIRNHRPAYGYINHLRAFLALWLFFLPLALVGQSGWFTPLFALLITYGVANLFLVAQRLFDPFGFDLQDLKLNTRAAASAAALLDAYALQEKHLPQLVGPTDTPPWLDRPPVSSDVLHPHSHHGMVHAAMHKARRIPTALFRKGVLLPMIAFSTWAVAVVMLTWAVSRDNENVRPECRWWCLYLPVDTETTSYVGLGLFLTLGFWLNDAHQRYWDALQLWHTNMRSAIHRLAFQIGLLCREGTWHKGDVSRLLSFVAALPYAARRKLRDSADLSDLTEILGDRDTHALADASDGVAYCLSVIHGYLNSLDSRDEHTLGSGRRPVNMSMFTMVIAAWDLETYIVSSLGVRQFPISPSFTRHLQLFAVIFLALLPLPLVEHDGFFALVYLPAVGYSIIKLFDLGSELTDPFGCDHHDVPLDLLCQELRNEVHVIYKETRVGVRGIVHEGDYSRDKFETTAKNRADEKPAALSKLGLLRKALQRVIAYFPPVSPWVQLASTIWTFIAVFASWGLAQAWEESKRESTDCREWCSPIDVEESVPLELGFALFVLLAFRASDAMQRFQEGAQYMHQLGLQLRVLLMEVIQAYDGGVWHKADKERIAAHFIQIPLFLKSELLGHPTRSKEGLLSTEDLQACEESPDPVRYCIQVIEAYILALDTPTAEWDYESAKKQRPSNTLVFTKIARVRQISESIERIRGIKRFGVVESYTNHQRLVTALWLVLLPLSMTATTGFVTLFWAPLVSYGVLALEHAATTMVDPFGSKKDDLPTENLTDQMVNGLLDALKSTKWDYHEHVRPSERNNEAILGAALTGTEVTDGIELPYLSHAEIDATNYGSKPLAHFDGLNPRKAKPSLPAHVARSVPWWVLLLVAGWTTLGVVLSYVSRTDSTNERWWESRIKIDDMVATYIGFPTFMLLGFYVQAAFSRHSEAGDVWGDHLRASCHTTALQWLLWASEGTWHKGDHERVIAHIASIPIALKMELRGERDVRELAGLLSREDLGKLTVAESMTTHLLDVIRTYYFSGQCRPESLPDPSKLITDFRKSFIKFEMQNLEDAVRRCKFIANFDIPPAIIVLLRTMLGIWFLLLPFVFAEVTGWFSILWVTLVAYGLLGMFSIASELRQPFGLDLNDLDLDSMAQEIVRDVLFVYKNHRGAVDTLVVKHAHFSHVWNESKEEDGVSKVAVPQLDKDDSKEELVSKTPILLTFLYAVPIWAMFLAIAWSAASVGAAYAVNRNWPMNITDCGPGFCSRIAVDGFVNEFVGFALFLLLGLRSEDSYRRYDNAQTIWREEILGMARLLSNRMFEGYPSGTFHDGDQERIAAHLAAFAVVTVEKLRQRKSSVECLHEIMCADDVRRVESAIDKEGYCADVVRGYLTEADIRRGRKESPSAGIFVHWMSFIYLRRMQEGAVMCQRLIKVPLPYGFVQHIRTFLIIWLGLLPLGLVEFCGWYTVLWVSFIAYGVIGIERWASELADPFGVDLSGIPLGDFRLKVYKLVKKNLDWYHQGNVAVIKMNRPGLPVPQGELE